MAENLEFVIGAKDKFSGSFGKLQSALPSIRKAALAASAAFAGMGAAMFAMVKTTATAYDKVQKLSDRLGVATEALSKMHYAAELSGVSTETVNMALQRMTRRVAESAVGMGVATKALNELGLNAEELFRLKPDEQFMKIAESMDGVASQSDKVRLAFSLFDSEGVRLVQMLKDGSNGLKDMMDEAEKFGLVITEQAGANAAKFNDSLTRLIGAMKGVKNHFSEEMLPIFTAGFNKLADIVANNRDKIVGSFRYIADGMISFVDILMKAASMATAGVGKIFGAVEKILGWYQTLIEFEMKLANFVGMDTARNALSLLAAKIDWLRGSLESGGESADEYAAKIEALRQTVNAFFADIKDVDSLPGLPSGDKQNELYDAATERARKYLEYIAALNSEYGELTIQQAAYVADREKEIAQMKSDALRNITNDLYSAMGSLGKDYFELMKNIQTIDAIISTYASAQKAYESLVWIPGVGPALAVAAAAAAIIAGMARVAQIRAQNYPSAHGGMSNVPKEQTYLLDAGERVLSPKQNQDLKDFMNNGGGGPNVTGNNFNLSFPNTDLSGMSKSQVEDFTEQKLAPALKKLALQGLY